MSFENRLRAAHRELEVAGVWKINSNPPLMRLLRIVGLNLPPLYYWRFRTTVFFLALWYGSFMGLYMWFFVDNQDIKLLGLVVVINLIGGILFGLSMALYFRYKSKKLHLSNWQDFP